MRFIGGTDSRTWLMKLTYTDPATATPVVVPFWQIGTEQGLLNNPVQRQEIDLMPGERIDVLVDFSAVPAGTRIMMQNLGPDTPWPGYFEYQAGAVAPSVDIPEIMAFNVVPLTAPSTVLPPSAATNLRPLTTPVPPLGSVPTINNTRVVSLMEITDGFGRTMPTIDARGFKPVGIPVTEIVKLNETEQWDIVNTTVDAHPMHLHQVAFKIINRQLIDPLGFIAPTDNIVSQVFTPASYTVAAGSLPILPDAWDDGWKDTVASPPGYVTRVWAKFDIPGEYVWHCHILSHEEHDMMRNFIVTDAAFAAPAPASITAPATSATGAYTISWVGTAIAGVTYELQEATDSAFATAVTVQNSTVPSFTAAKTLNNNYYYRVRALPPAASGFTTGLWKTATKPVKVQLPLAITVTVLPAAAVNTAFTSTTINPVNGVTPYSFTATGLPAGLTIDPATGIISGTPTPATIVTGISATYPITITITDSAVPAVPQSAAFSLVVNQSLPAAPTLLTGTTFGSTQINLTWVDNANNETGFTLQRATNATFTKALTTFAALPANTMSYSDLTVLAGTTYYYRVASTNALGSSTFAVSPLVKPAVLAITTKTLAAASVNLAYTATLAATGGAAPYIWSATGLPASMTINPTTGVISGIPTPADIPAGALSATFTVTITVQDSFVPAAVATTLVPINLVINQVLPAAPTLGTAAAFGTTQVNLAWVDNANNEAGYTVQRATDNLFTLGLTTIALPANTTTYSDTTVVAGSKYFYRIASNNIVGTSKYFVAVPKPVTTQALIAVATAVLPASTVNKAYTTTLKATGGLAPYTWSATGLPAGLTIAPTTGIISGIPAPANVPTGVPVTFPVSITVQDSFITAQSITVVINLVVNQVLPVAPTLMTAALVGTTQINLAWVDNSNNETGFTVQRATDAAFTLGLVTVAVPANTTVYADTTALPGTSYYYRVASTNGLGTSAYAVALPKPIKTLAPLAITAVVLKNATVNTAYTVTLKATGGLAPYTWSATGLPAGLTIAPTTGIISGIPTLSPTLLTATYPVTVTVTDGVSVPAVSALSLIVNQAKPAVPALLTAVAALPTQVNLSWTASSTNVSSYTLQRSTVATFTAAKTVTTVLPAGSTLYSDTTAVTKTIYYYRINATNAAGVSAYTAAVTVTTP
jgi:heme exporter protein D